MEKKGVMPSYKGSLQVNFSPTNGEVSFACTDNGFCLDFLNAVGSNLCDEQGDNYRRDAR